MHLPAMLASTLAVAAQAAPTSADADVEEQEPAYPMGAHGSLSAYFSLIAAEVGAAKMLSGAPVCDLSQAQMPSGVQGLPAPSDGLTVRHVAVGRGTQNYTCGAGGAPQAAGAVAMLFNASCVAALLPDVLERIPSVAVHLELDKPGRRLGADTLATSGVHYFADSSTPLFDLTTPTLDIGKAPCTKNSSVKAPSTAAVGQLGEKAVAWLRMTTKDGATGGIREVYRVTTAGGSPPATCEGVPATFQVPYAAVYWFWQGEHVDEAAEG